jgi:hypothetical protein
MLSKLNWITGLLTFLYVVVLTALGSVPKIEVPKTLIPPIHGWEATVNWALSFGGVPIASGMIAFLLSRAFEMHNICSKVLQVRYLWDKYFVVKPLRARVNSLVPLSRKTVRAVMNDFYYKEVQKIDQHYIQLFWRYTLPFWILFEHAIVVIASIVILWLLNGLLTYNLLRYLAVIIVIGAIQFFLVASRKSLDQVRQIPITDVQKFFDSLRLITRR